MRQVFSSARIENVEAVAKMLETGGIEVRIEHGRSFRSAIRGNFSYRDGAGNAPKPTLWVIRSEDQPRARQMLREAGLLDAQTTRPGFLPDTPHTAIRQRDALYAKRRAARFRYGLLILGAIVAAAIWLKPRPDAPLPARRAAQAIDPALDVIATAPETAHRLPVPHALAVAIVLREHAARPGASCLGIDGGDPPAPVLQALRAQGIAAHPAGDCPRGARRVEVREWRTDGSGSGEVAWTVASADGQPQARSAPARRDGDDWHVDEAP